jgi:glycine cleavage system H protein
MSLIPDGLFYTKEHEWIKIENNIGTIGITDFAQSSLGDIVYIELPTVGSSLTIGKTFGVVESIKSVSDLYAPLSGKILERQESILKSPELCNSGCYEHWMLKIEISSEELSQIKKLLLSAEDYKKYLASL